MSLNPYRRLFSLTPAPRLDVGEVTATTATTATIQLHDGTTIQARGTATIGDYVWVRNGQIEGPAPALTGTDIEV